VSPFPRHRSAYRGLASERFPWERWETLIQTNGVKIERPAQEPHPDYPHIVYPLDYGFIPGTIATDGDAVDCFIGSGNTRLAGMILTTDHREGDREVKLLIDCTPEEIYTAHGFINYDRTLLEGVLVMRHPMHTLWNH